jgi:hypothetical protein
MRRRPPDPAPTLASAFDELRFGRGGILHLRETLPTGDEAARRTEAWLRERQMARAGEVLVVTGRGKGSAGGVSVVREAVARLLASLGRRGVVAEWSEHTQGSFVVRLAPTRKLYETSRAAVERRPALVDPAELGGLDAPTRGRLRALAVRSLDALGVQAPGEPLIPDEMVSQFARLAAAAEPGPGREAALRAAVERALLAHDGDDA